MKQNYKNLIIDQLKQNGITDYKFVTKIENDILSGIVINQRKIKVLTFKDVKIEGESYFVINFRLFEHFNK